MLDADVLRETVIQLAAHGAMLQSQFGEKSDPHSIMLSAVGDGILDTIKRVLRRKSEYEPLIEEAKGRITLGHDSRIEASRRIAERKRREGQSSIGMGTD